MGASFPAHNCLIWSHVHLRSSLTQTNLDTNLDDTPRIVDYGLPDVPPPPPHVIKTDTGFAGNSAEDYFNSIMTPTDDTPTTQGALERRRYDTHGLTSSSRPTRSRSSTKELMRLLLSREEGRDSRQALSLLRGVSERLEQETNRANEAERRVQEANDRWRLVNQARLQAQADMARVNEELRLYKMQLDAAQSQITRANDMISQTDKERAQAEDDAAKARRQAKRYEMELLIKQAKEEGRRIGRREGYEEARFRTETYRGRDRREDYPPYEDGFDEETYAEDMTVPVPYEDEYDDPRPPPEAAHREEPPRRRRSLINRLRRRPGDIDRNVEVNPGAPDIGPIVVDESNLQNLASPRPPQDIAPVTRHQHQPIEPEFAMPVPEYDPDPADVHPLVVSNAPRSPAHTHVEYPPEGYIPRVDSDGAIRLPPPHELSHAPPSPADYASPLPPATTLPQVEQVRESSARDLGTPHRSSRRHHRHAGSVDSSDTSALSIISPPTKSRLAKEPVLSAIPEASPRHSNRGSMNGFPLSPRAGGSGFAPSASGDGGVRPDMVGFRFMHEG